MADELKKGGEGEGTDHTPEPKQFTEIEQRAVDSGWVPQEEWAGEPDAWRPAKEFLDRGELFKKIDEQNRTIKEFKRTLDDFSKHHAKVRETEYKRALDDLKTQKREALAEGDVDAIIDIDERIDLVKEAQRQPTPQVQEPVTNPVFQAWVQKNGWYETNRAMRAFADTLGNQLGAAGGISPADLLAEIERQVKQEFSHKFENPRRNTAQTVEGSSNKGGGKAKDSFVLSEEERRAMKRFVREIPGFTEEKYISDLRAIKGAS